MNDEDYFKRVKKDFDLDESVKVAVWSAQFFIEQMGFSEEDALKEMNISKEQYDKFKTLPLS